MKAGLLQEWEWRSKWNIIFLEIIDNKRSAFSLGQFGLPIFGFIMELTNSFMRYTVGLSYNGCTVIQGLVLGILDSS